MEYFVAKEASLDLDDAIYSHPLFSAPVEDLAETISSADVESTALPQHLVTHIS